MMWLLMLSCFSFWGEDNCFNFDQMEAFGTATSRLRGIALDPQGRVVLATKADDLGADVVIGTPGPGPLLYLIHENGLSVERSLQLAGYEDISAMAVDRLGRLYLFMGRGKTLLMMVVDWDGQIYHEAPVGDADLFQVFKAQFDAADRLILHGSSYTAQPNKKEHQRKTAVPNVWIGRLNTDFSLDFSRVIGGNDRDNPGSILILADGSFLIGITSRSTDLMGTPGAYLETNPGRWSAYLFRLSEDGETVIYASWFGGPFDDNVSGLGLSPQGDLYVSGGTDNVGLGTPGAYQELYGGGGDLFLTKLDLGLTQPPIWYTYFNQGIFLDDGYRDLGGRLIMADGVPVLLNRAYWDGNFNSTSSIIGFSEDGTTRTCYYNGPTELIRAVYSRKRLWVSGQNYFSYGSTHSIVHLFRQDNRLLPQWPELSILEILIDLEP